MGQTTLGILLFVAEIVLALGWIALDGGATRNSRPDGTRVTEIRLWVPIAFLLAGTAIYCAGMQIVGREWILPGLAGALIIWARDRARRDAEAWQRRRSITTYRFSTSGAVSVHHRTECR